jgi:hypothetical protein
MRQVKISITLCVIAAALLAGPGPALSASYNKAVCRDFGPKLRRANESGGMRAMVKEMSRLLRAKRLDDMGLVAEEGVRCAMIASEDISMVVDVALAAGVDRDTVKRGIERHFRFRDLKVPDLGVPDLGIFETTGRLRIEINIFGGLSTGHTVVGSTVDNKDVRLDGGGGYGGGMTMGYGINPNLDFDLALGYHVTGLDPRPQDTEGSFQRYSVLALLKHRSYTSARSWLKVGGGVGYFVPVFYRYGSGLAGYEEIEYESAPGAVASVEYESAIGKETVSSSFVLGLRYYYVVYDALKATDDTGVDVPLTNLPEDLLDLDGSSVEITAGIVTYF